MKKLTSVVTLISLMLSANGSIYFSTTDLYPKTAVVTCVDEESDMVYCMDYTKNLWSFEGSEDWETGDVVSMIMDTKGTDTIYDDEIVSIRYNGTPDGFYPYGKETSEDELFAEYLEEIASGNYTE